MPWASSAEGVEQQQARILQSAQRWQRVVARLARAQFRRQLEAIMDALQDATTARDVRGNVRQTLGTVRIKGGEARPTTEVAEGWMRLYRQVFLRVGAEFAREGVPPQGREERQDEGTVRIGTAWGPPSDPWWDEEFLDTFGGEEDWWDPWQSNTLDYAETAGAQKVKYVNETTRHLIQDEVQDALQRGESINDIRARIRRLHLEQIIPNRSEVIARTEALNAARAGDYHATRATGFSADTTKSWLVTLDGRARATHEEAGTTSRNQNVPFNQPFEVRNPVSGHMEQLLFPGDASLGASAANIIQCRCDVLKAL